MRALLEQFAAVAIAATLKRPASVPASARPRGKLIRQIATCKRAKRTHSRLIVRIVWSWEVPRRNPATGLELHPERQTRVERYLLDGRAADRIPFACGARHDPGHSGHGYADVDGHSRPNQKCGARCMASKGPSCECRCGGRNHGGSYEGSAS